MTYPYGQPGGPPQGGPPFGAPPGQQAPGYPHPAGFGQPYSAGPVHADWGQRAGAYLVDFAPLLAGVLIAVLVSLVSGAAGTIVYLLAILGTLAWTVFNRWINGGATGQSLGKRIAGIKLVSEATGEPIGAGMAFVRDVAHALDSMALGLGYLWPLWDDKAQTFSDKILSTVVVRAGPEPAGAPGFGQGGFARPGGFPGLPGGFGQPGGFPGQNGGFPGQPGPAPQPGFGQPSPNAAFPAASPGSGAPRPGFGWPPVPGTPPQQGFAQPGVPPRPAFGQPGPTPFDRPEPTQVVRPPATQMIKPESPKPGPAQS
ncbi:RDD family protein [Amycolatopsis rubida]|uniref:Uncharacterized membrane protein YckC, RDD family n=1 Tax=Amycolatopsis rubida TaxID=112413 RepID=A0A1I5K6D7_9PSEU|nr:RDD family protein [Amycolatopsis rubida]SFO80547.1 Uncharacterized membrane protein YckC, RDD family [Amycolatopsis rubida]